MNKELAFLEDMLEQMDKLEKDYDDNLVNEDEGIKELGLIFEKIKEELVPKKEVPLKEEIVNNKDCPVFQEEVKRKVYEHEILLSFPSDEGAEYFTYWWNSEGKRLWLNYYKKAKE